MELTTMPWTSVQEKIAQRISGKGKSAPCHKVVFLGGGCEQIILLHTMYDKQFKPKDWAPSVFDRDPQVLYMNDLPFSVSFCSLNGQENYDRIRHLNYQDANVFVFCFSIVPIDDKIVLSTYDEKADGPLASLDAYREAIMKKFKFFRNEMESEVPHATFLLCGLNAEARVDYLDDARFQHLLSMEDGHQLCDTLNCREYIEVSASRFQNLDYFALSMINGAIQSHMDPPNLALHQKEEQQQLLFGEDPPIIKAVFVGHTSAKTKVLFSLTNQKSFEDDEYVPTVFDNYKEQYTFNDDLFGIAFWDTAGQEEYNSVRPLSYDHGDVFVICFSILNVDAYVHEIQFWSNEIRANGHHHKSFLLLGTHHEARSSSDALPVVPHEAIMKLCQQCGFSNYLEVSSTTFHQIMTIPFSIIAAYVQNPLLHPRRPTFKKKKKKKNKLYQWFQQAKNTLSGR